MKQVVADIDSLRQRIQVIEREMMNAHLNKDQLDALRIRVDLLEERQAIMGQDIANILSLLDRLVGSIEIGIDTRKLSISEMIHKIDDISGSLRMERVELPQET